MVPISRGGVLLETHRSEQGKVMKEYEVKELLNSKGIATPRGVVLKKIEEPIKINFPVALKVSDPKILHKSDVGGVVTGIKDQQELIDEFSKMREKFPESEFLIEEMVKPGVEIIVGVTFDETFGHTLMLGLGGIYTEIYQDVAFRLIPIERVDAADMINEVSIKRFCQGFRGMRVDQTELENFLLKISDLVVGIGKDIEQLDLNPVIINDKSITVVDAKLIYRTEK